MAVCPNLAELLFPHVTDSITWCRLAQVNKRFYQVAKQFLIKKTEMFRLGPYGGFKTVWTELPNRKKHGAVIKIDPTNNRRLSETYYSNNEINGPHYSWTKDGMLCLKCSYKNGVLHGHYQSWFYNDAQLSFNLNYLNGQKYGLCESWYGDGTLHYSRIYRGDMQYEKLNN